MTDELTWSANDAQHAKTSAANFRESQAEQINIGAHLAQLTAAYKRRRGCRNNFVRVASRAGGRAAQTIANRIRIAIDAASS